MKDTKDNIFTWLEDITLAPSGKHFPVMFKREEVATRFNISIRQVERHMNSFVKDNKLFRYKLYNNIYVYSFTPLDMSKPMYIRVTP